MVANGGMDVVGDQRVSVLEMNARWSWIVAAAAAFLTFVLATHLILLASVVLRVLIAVGVVAALRWLLLREFAISTAMTLLALVAWASFIEATGYRPSDMMVRTAAVTSLTMLMLMAGVRRSGRVALIARAHPATAIAVAIVAFELHPMSDVTIISGGSDFAVLGAVLLAPAIAAVTARWSSHVRAVISIAEPFLIAIVVWLIVLPHLVVADLRWPILKSHYLQLVVPCSIAAILVLILFEYVPLFLALERRNKNG